MNSLQSFNSVASDSWGNNPLTPFIKGESMIRQQYQECPAYRVNSFLKVTCEVLDSFRKIAYVPVRM